MNPTNRRQKEGDRAPVNMGLVCGMGDVCEQCGAPWEPGFGGRGLAGMKRTREQSPLVTLS